NEPEPAAISRDDFQCAWPGCAEKRRFYGSVRRRSEAGSRSAAKSPAPARGRRSNRGRGRRRTAAPSARSLAARPRAAAYRRKAWRAPAQAAMLMSTISPGSPRGSLQPTKQRRNRGDGTRGADCKHSNLRGFARDRVIVAPGAIRPFSPLPRSRRLHDLREAWQFIYIEICCPATNLDLSSLRAVACDTSLSVRPLD